MKQIEIVRAHHGRRVHRRIAGAASALCGYTPQSSVMTAQLLKTGSSWHVYEKSPDPANDCAKCMATLPERK